ncbi:MAG: DUF3533 domain-containing protein [Ilumatobacteraceae bacterium]
MADQASDDEVPTAENPVVEPLDDLFGTPPSPLPGSFTIDPRVVTEPGEAVVAGVPPVIRADATETDTDETDTDIVAPAADAQDLAAPAQDLAVADAGGTITDADATSATLAPRRSSLTRPLPWLAVGAGLLLAALMTFAYVGAFVDPLDELHDLKIAVVNLDQPVEVAGQTIGVGGEVVRAATAGSTGAVAWVAYESRDAVLDALGRNELAGAVILPADLSARVGAIGTTLGAAPQAQIEVLRNAGAGSLQPAVVDEVTDALLRELNASVAERLSSTLTSLGVQVAPANVAALATPVVASVADAPDIGNHGGRGLPPLYIAVMTTLTGLVGAIAIHTAVGAVAGRERIEVMGRELAVGRLRVRPGPRYWQEAALVGVLAVGSAIVIPWVAVGLLGAHADRPFLAMPVVALGVLVAGWLTLLCVTALGVLGEVIVVLLTTIFGVPSARGVYPAEALPGLFRVLGTFLPLRFLTDAMRAVFFFGGNDDAGLRTAFVVLWIWALGSLLAGGLVAGALSRRELRDRRAAALVAPT